MALSSAVSACSGAWTARNETRCCSRRFRAARRSRPVHVSYRKRRSFALSPIATWALIATNVVIFLFEVNLSPSELNEFLYSFALVPARYLDSGMFDSSLSLNDYLPFVSNMFLHGGWFHLIVNMWTLCVRKSSRRSTGLWAISHILFRLRILASVTYAVLNRTPRYRAGASGAIAGILGCYMRLFPFSQIVVMIPILFIPLFFEFRRCCSLPLVPLSGTGAITDWSARSPAVESLGGSYRWVHRRRYSRGPLRPPRAAMAARRR